MITNHRYRSHPSKAEGRPATQGCCWMGKCRRPEAVHAYVPRPLPALRRTLRPHVFRGALDLSGFLDLSRCGFNGTCNRAPEEHPLTVAGRSVLTISAIVER